MNAKETERQDAIEELRKVLRPGDTVYTILRHVSRSGMTRGIDVYRMADKQPVWITGYVGKAIGQPQSFKDWNNSYGLRISGCGMDMGFHVVNTLSYILFPDSFECIGEGCPANDHVNGDRDYTPHMHSKGAGAYALKHEWL